MTWLLTIDPSLRQIVNKGTRGPRVLDFILTNLSVFFEEPEIVPPIAVDNPAKGGVPSVQKNIKIKKAQFLSSW